MTRDNLYQDLEGIGGGKHWKSAIQCQFEGWDKINPRIGWVEFHVESVLEHGLALSLGLDMAVDARDDGLRNFYQFLNIGVSMIEFTGRKLRIVVEIQT